MNCKNCFTPLNEKDEYCRNCGAKVIRNRLTFRNLFEHLSETFFNYDNKLLRTLIDLIKKPEEVIGGYIEGVRKRHVNPISFFGLSLTILGIEWLVLRKFFPEQMDLSAMVIEGQESLINEIFSFLQDYSSIFTMLLVPLYALFFRIVFLDCKKYNYVELIVAFAYMMALISLVGAVLNIIGLACGLDLGYMGYINILITLIYLGHCLKRLYKINFISVIGRLLLFIVVLFVAYIGVFIIIILGLYLIDGKDGIMEFLEAFKPRN